MFCASEAILAQVHITTCFKAAHVMAAIACAKGCDCYKCVRATACGQVLREWAIECGQTVYYNKHSVHEPSAMEIFIGNIDMTEKLLAFFEFVQDLSEGQLQQLRVVQKHPHVFAFATLSGDAANTKKIVRKLHRAKFGERLLCSYIAEPHKVTKRQTRKLSELVMKRQSTTGELVKKMAKLNID
jgi:hypothetical protein